MTRDSAAMRIGSFSYFGPLKGIVHQKMNILSLITHPHFVPNP